MNQAVRDLREMYGNEVDSDEGLDDCSDEEDDGIDGDDLDNIIAEGSKVPFNAHIPAHREQRTPTPR